MVRKKGYIIGGMGLVALLLLTASAVFALHEGVAYYLAQTIQSGNTAIQNPTRREMFALLIVYDNDENFDGCQGMVLSPNDVESIKYGSSFEGFAQIIAAPTSGAYSFTGAHGIGIIARQRHRNFFLLNPLLFSFQDSDVQDCACSELDSFKLPRTLLRPFRINCAA